MKTTYKDILESFTSKVIKKTKEKTIDDKRESVVNIIFDDPEVERICHDHGVYTINDAANVETIMIGHNASWFTGNNKIKSFEEFKYFTGIKNPVIEQNTFYDCDKLEKIELPNHIVQIMSCAFSGCTNLYSIKLPEKLSTIEIYAFFACKNLKEIELPSSLNYIGHHAFSNSGLVSIDIPDSVDSISHSAFLTCQNLKSVKLPKHKLFNALNDDIFRHCNSLVSIDIPDNVTTIRRAFCECQNLRTITISTNIINILSDAFADTDLRHIFVRDLDNSFDGENGFKERLLKGMNRYETLKNRKINIVKMIDNVNESFTSNVIKKTKETTQEEKRLDLIQIKFEDPEVERICHEHGIYTYGDAYKTTDLYKIINPTTGKKLSWFCTSSIKTFNEFKYFKGIKNIGSSLFQECTFLQSITLPDNIINIEQCSFAGCKSLQSINIPNSVINIEYQAFYGCSSLQSINIPNSVTTIGERCFAFCEDLKSINISNNLNNIKDSTFLRCKSLQSINIPDSVINIGDAFYGCLSLNTIYISKNHHLLRSLKRKNDTKHCKFIDPNKVNESFTSNVIKKTKETTQENKREQIVAINFKDPEVERICHEKGVYSIQDAANVKHLYDDLGRNGWHSWFAYTNIKEFDELKYFTGLEGIDFSDFSYCRELTHVTLPPNIKYINNHSFRSCKNLRSIIIPNGVTTIGDSCFEDDIRLRSIFIPSTVKNYGGNVFSNTFLRYVYVDTDDFIKNLPLQILRKKESIVFILVKDIEELKKSIDDFIFDPTKYKNLIPIEKPFDVNESFTSNVIKKSKNTTQEEKREIVSDYVDLGLPSGNLWCKHNYGISDKNKYGGYYTWYEARDLNCDVIINQVPTVNDFKELGYNCKFEPTEVDGMTGLLITSKTNGNSIFFPSLGYYYTIKGNKDIFEDFNTNGFYWSSSYSAREERKAYALCFSSICLGYDGAKDLNLKFPVRTIKKKKEIKESFTSNVIKNVKDKSQKQKREEIINFYNLTLGCIQAQVEKVKGLKNKGEHYWEMMPPSINSYGESEESGNKIFGFTILSDKKNRFFASLYISFSEKQCCASIQEVEDDGVSEYDLLEGCNIIDSWNDTYALDKISHELIITIVKNYLRTRKSVFSAGVYEPRNLIKMYREEIGLSESFTRNIDVKNIEDYKKKQLEEIKNSLESIIKLVILQNFTMLKEYKTESTGSVYRHEYIIDYDSFFIYFSQLLKEKSLVWQPEGSLILRIDEGINQISVRDSETRHSFVNMSNCNDSFFNMVKSHSRSSAPFIAKMCYVILKKRLDDKTKDLIKEELLKKVNFDSLFESFTSNVIKKTKDTSIEKKREIVSEFVDLGLPSKTLWCSHNYGTEKEEGRGNYYTFPDSQKIEFNNNNEKIASIKNYRELKDYCKHEWKEINGRCGRLFTSKINGNSIFLPAAGCLQNDLNDPRKKILFQDNSDGYYWTSDKYEYNEQYAYDALLDECGVSFEDFYAYKLCEYPIRTIISKEKIEESFTSKVIERSKESTTEENRKELFDYVDLGLPSGTLWKKYNVGANEEAEHGKLFSYDEMNQIDTKLGSLPTVNDFRELRSNCEEHWMESYEDTGIRGYLFISKINNNYIFLPADGYGEEGSQYFLDSNGYYWTTDLTNAYDKLNGPMYNIVSFDDNSLLYMHLKDVKKAKNLSVRLVKK